VNAYFVAAFAALHALGATPEEERTLKWLVTVESRWHPEAVNGPCCGPWQTNHYIASRLLGETITCKDLQTKPDMAAKSALAFLRKMREPKVCGPNWYCGWRHGPYSDSCEHKCKQPKTKPKRKKHEKAKAEEALRPLRGVPGLQARSRPQPPTLP
jgi:hypothetical protein